MNFRRQACLAVLATTVVLVAGAARADVSTETPIAALIEELGIVESSARSDALPGVARAGARVRARA